MSVGSDSPTILLFRPSFNGTFCSMAARTAIVEEKRRLELMAIVYQTQPSMRGGGAVQGRNPRWLCHMHQLLGLYSRESACQRFKSRWTGHSTLQSICPDPLRVVETHTQVHLTRQTPPWPFASPFHDCESITAQFAPLNCTPGEQRPLQPIRYFLFTLSQVELLHDLSHDTSPHQPP